MNQRTLGRTGPAVSALGLGAMGMSDFYGPADRDESIATIHAALDAGITLLDTGDFYGMGHNELLIAEALRGRKREDVLLSVKFGAQRDPAGNWIGYAASPPAVKTALAYTLRRLNTEYVDIYRPARLDSAVPIEETIGAIGELVQAGYVRHVGLSEVGAETIRRAAAVHPIADLQIEYSLVSRGIEDAILPTCRELGIGITAYGVLSRGLISGHWTKERSSAEHGFRAHSPRFVGENLDRNLALVEALRAIADAKGRQRRADRHRLGARARRGHRAGDRRAAPRPAARGARRARRPLECGRHGADRAGRAAGRRGRQPLCRGADAAPRQRTRRRDRARVMRRVGAAEIAARKGGAFPVVTAYDAPFARCAEAAGIDVVLVGDSLGMVVLGYASTTEVELTDMVRHGAAVARGTGRAHVIVDLPFGTYEASDALAVASATELVKRGGAASVKLEGGVSAAARIGAIVGAGIPVCAHIGVLPQTAALGSGFRLKRERERLLRDAQAVAEAGAFAVVLEMVADDLAAEITQQLAIPTIGIGSGPRCDAQVLVLHDVLGLYPDAPPFAKRYADLAEAATGALRAYADDVRAGTFPTERTKATGEGSGYRP